MCECVCVCALARACAYTHACAHKIKIENKAAHNASYPAVAGDPVSSVRRRASCLLRLFLHLELKMVLKMMMRACWALVLALHPPLCEYCRPLHAHALASQLLMTLNWDWP